MYYTPDSWVVLKITSHAQVMYKIFAGFATQEQWRTNSGIISAEEQDECIIFHGMSGSAYLCRKDGYKLSFIMEQSLSTWQEELQAVGLPPIVVLPEDTDWVNFDFSIIPV